MPKKPLALDANTILATKGGPAPEGGARGESRRSRQPLSGCGGERRTGRLFRFGLLVQTTCRTTCVSVLFMRRLGGEFRPVYADSIRPVYARSSGGFIWGVSAGGNRCGRADPGLGGSQLEQISPSLVLTVIHSLIASPPQCFVLLATSPGPSAARMRDHSDGTVGAAAAARSRSSACRSA